MIQNNIYERLPLFKLQEIVGISQLENIRGVLEALNETTLNPELIYTKGFLAAYARSNLNIKYLFSPEGSFELINTLNDEEMMGLAVEIGGINLFSSREDFISNAVRLMRKHEYRKPTADFLGLGEFINFDSKVIKLPTSIKYEESLLPYKPLKDYQFEVYF